MDSKGINRSHSKAWKGKILSLILGLAFALAAGEIAARVLVPTPIDEFIEDINLGWSTSEYRQFDPNQDPDDGTKPRILVLGDSYLAPAYVRADGFDTRYPRVAERSLRGRITTGILSSSGWGTDQELLAFRQKGRAWKPDLVVVSFCANNDLCNIISNFHRKDFYKPYFVLDDSGVLSLHKPDGTPLERLQQPSSQGGGAIHSRLLEVLLDALPASEAANSPASPAAVDPRYRLYDRHEDVPSITGLGSEIDWSPQNSVTGVSAFIHEDFELNTYQCRLLEAILSQMKTEVEASGAELVVTLLPVTYLARDLGFITGSTLEHQFQTPDGTFTYRAAEPRDRLAEDLQQSQYRTVRSNGQIYTNLVCDAHIGVDLLVATGPPFLASRA